jgi:membrane fusion protein (multidrug efflux system)
MESIKKEQSNKVYIPLILVIILILGGGIRWYIDYSKYINTDDAHVETDNVAVSSKILGRISQLFAEEGDSVKQGQLLVVLDSLDLAAQKKPGCCRQKFQVLRSKVLRRQFTVRRRRSTSFNHS